MLPKTEKEPLTKKAKTPNTEPLQALASPVAGELERVVHGLKDRLEDHNKRRQAVQDELHALCSQYIKEIDILETEENSRIERAFEEDAKPLQKVLETFGEQRKHRKGD